MQPPLRRQPEQVDEERVRPLVRAHLQEGRLHIATNDHLRPRHGRHCAPTYIPPVRDRRPHPCSDQRADEGERDGGGHPATLPGAADAARELRRFGDAGESGCGEHEPRDMSALGDREVGELDAPPRHVRATGVVLEEAPNDSLHDAYRVGKSDAKRFVHRQVRGDLCFQIETAGRDVSDRPLKLGFPPGELESEGRHRPVTVHPNVASPVHSRRRRARRGRVASHTISPPCSSASAAKPSVTSLIRSRPIRFCGRRTNTDQPARGCNRRVLETTTCALS